MHIQTINQWCCLALGLFSLGLASTPLLAQNRLVSLPEVLRVAVETHPSVQAKKSELKSSNFGLDISKWQRYPGVSAQSSAGQVGGSVLTSVRLEQPIWNGGRTQAGIEVANAKVEASVAAIQESEQAILARTASAFSETIRLQARIAAADENIAEHLRLLELIERRAKSEVSPASEAIMARARYVQALAERIQFSALASNARADLAQIVGENDLRLLEPKVDLIPTATLDEMIDMGLSYSPQLHRLVAETKSSDADVDLKKSALAPQISARYEHFWGGINQNDIVYLAVAYQPGAGLSSLSAIKEAEARRNSSELSSENVRKDVMDKIRTDWNQMQAAELETKVLRELVESTRGVYESFVRQYAAGRKSWVEVLNARREATQARYSLADSEWNGFLAGIRMDIATGKIAASTLSSEIRPNQ